ncbi:hypothetical protein [Streptomyces sp. 2P-4]|uniref:hypothetical protein n=1 Tax=Streptomyces sp. 2P-4 TaxID=2931974 RepID=UPI002540B5B2|nr:hypothetical protein [Streptomyces sp. 2P-4]
MSHMARGILAELLSRPDGWTATADDLWRESVKRHGKASPGRRQFRAAFAELKVHGYMGSMPAQLDGGQLGTVLTVRDIPVVTDVPHAGTSGRPGKTGITAGQTDVPASGTSERPGQTDVSAGQTDVPHAGTSYRRREEENGEKKKTGESWADAVGQPASGFASAGSRSGAAKASQQDEGGSAASAKTSPRPKTFKTRPRQTSPGFDLVRAAIPAEVARPGTRLYPGLHRAIEDLLTGNQAAGIPRRTPEQVLARLNRRWYGEKADARSAPGYRGCERCTSSGCQAPRRSHDNPDGCDRIRNRSSWLAAALLAQDCADPGCEDGQIIDGGACPLCAERAAEQRAITAAAEKAAARWKTDIAASQDAAAARSVVDAWTAREKQEDHRFRSQLAAAGMYGSLLDHRVEQHMAGWRDRNPRPKIPAQGAQAPVQGAFLLAWPESPAGQTAGPENAAQLPARRKRTVVCDGCDQGHRTDLPDTLCPTCRQGATA